MFIDTFLIKFYDIVKKNFITLDEKKVLFTIITSACLILELIIFYYMKKLIKKTKVNMKLNLGSIDNIVYSAQFSLIMFISILIIQIFYFNYYLSYILMIIITIIFGTTAFLIGKITGVFVSWYRIRHNRIFFIYALSLSMIIFNLVMTAIVLNLILIEKPEQIRQFVGGSMDLNAGKYLFLLLIFKISTILSFGSIWLTTALLMHVSKDQLSNRFRIWSLLSIPVIYFLARLFCSRSFFYYVFIFSSN